MLWVLIRADIEGEDVAETAADDNVSVTPWPLLPSLDPLGQLSALTSPPLFGTRGVRGRSVPGALRCSAQLLSS